MKSFTFKVKYHRWSAELLLSEEHDLRDLAYAILEAVGFGDDHAYGFYDNLRNPYRSVEEYTLFATQGEGANPDDPGVEGVPVGTVFTPRKQMLFFFDYGDEWRFIVTCTDEKDVPAFKEWSILSTRGAAPKQYPGHESDED